MQEINLLQNKVKDRTLQFERSNRIVLTVFGLLIALEVAAAVGLYLITKSTTTKAAEIASENIQIQTAMNQDQNTLTAAQGLQAQLKNVKTLLTNHIYWTEFFNQVTSVVPLKVRFKSLNSSVSDNKVHFDAVAQSYQDIGRLLLALDASDKFKDVKLHSIEPSDSTEFGYSFSIDLTVTPNIFTKIQ